jgi:hypothetical protein
MAHVPGHKDDGQVYGGGMPVVPGQPYVPPPFSPAQIWANTQPRNAATQKLLGPAYDNPYTYGKTRQYADAYMNSLFNTWQSGADTYASYINAIPAYQTYVENGITYKWNPNTRTFEAVGNATPAAAASTGGGGGAGKEDPYAKMKRDADRRRLQARTAYMTQLAPIQERARLARVGQAEAPAALASSLAQRAIGGFGGISEAAKQFVGDQYRIQEAQAIASKVAAYADYLTSRLGIARDEANAIAAEAVKRADAGAAKVMAEMERRVAEYDKILEGALNVSAKQSDKELRELDRRLSAGGK